MFKFNFTTNLRFGVGEINPLKEEINKRGFKTIAVIIASAVLKQPSIKKAIADTGLTLDVYENETIEPTYDYLEKFKNRLAKLLIP